MRDYLYLGPVPFEEDCAQVGDTNFNDRATAEMTAYCDQLERMFPAWDTFGLQTYFSIKWENHDFGRYGEVIINYDPSKEDSVEFAFGVENDTPSHWDNIALKMLSNSPFVPLDKERLIARVNDWARVHYSDGYKYSSRQTFWTAARHEGVISDVEFDLGREHYQNLWDYAGD